MNAKLERTHSTTKQNKAIVHRFHTLYISHIKFKLFLPKYVPFSGQKFSGIFEQLSSYYKVIDPNIETYFDIPI